MESVQQQKTLTQTRRSHTREQKLRLYTDNRQNLYCTCQFDLNTKTVLQWLKSWKAVYDSKKGRKRVSFDRTAGLEVLQEENRKLHQQGLKDEGWWF